MPRVRGVSPRRAKPAVPAEPPKRGRGRPKIGERTYFILSSMAEDGLCQYLADWQDHVESLGPEAKLPKAAAVARDALTAYAESAAVRAAIAAWRAGRAT